MTSNTNKKPLVPNTDTKRKWVAKHMADSTRSRMPSGSGPLQSKSMDKVNARLDTVHYFDAWHRVAIDDEAAWMPIAPEVLLQFILGHVEGLPKDVANAIEARRTRRTDGRSYPATIEDHVRHISEAHTIEGLDDPADDVQVRKALRTARDQGSRET